MAFEGSELDELEEVSEVLCFFVAGSSSDSELEPDSSSLEPESSSELDAAFLF